MTAVAMTELDRDLCTECGTTYGWCTKGILSGREACCRACGNRDTHPVTEKGKSSVAEPEDEQDETHAEKLERLGTDPKRWAKEFITMFDGFAVREDGVDEDTMVRWFTNILAVGEALGQHVEPPAEPKEVPNFINHPPHYNWHPAGIECIDVVEHMGFNVGNAIKYLWRAGEKGSPIEDLKKSEWYIAREIQRRTKLT